MDNMKIIVPTDFSECARNALNYAIGFAGSYPSEIILMHSIVYADSGFHTTKAIEEENTIKYNNAREALDNEASYVRSKNQEVVVKTDLDAENAELALASIIEKEKADYVIMGTEGISGLKDAIFGSFTNSILLLSPIPVFTIPITAHFSNINYIVAATEMHDSENAAIKEIIKLAEIRNALLVFYNANSNEDEQRVKFSKFQKYIRSLTNYALIDYVIVESKDILKSLDGYMCEMNPRLLVTLGKERSLFESLFGKKVTKQLCLHTSVPLLSYPIHYKSDTGSEISDLEKSRQK